MNVVLKSHRQLDWQPRGRQKKCAPEQEGYFFSYNLPASGETCTPAQDSVRHVSA